MSLIPDDGCKESIGNVGNSFHTDMTLAVHLRRLHCKPILLNCNYLLDQEISCCYAAWWFMNIIIIACHMAVHCSCSITSTWNISLQIILILLS